MTREDRAAALLSALEARVLVLDGATGTAMHDANLGPGDYGGEAQEGCHEILCATRPDVVAGVHRAYLEAGADIVETNSFTGSPLVLAEYGLADRAYELAEAAARIARETCRAFDETGRLRFVCGAMGPTTKSISIGRDVTFADMQVAYRVQAAGLISGGADYLLLETGQDMLNVKAGLRGIEAACDDAGWRVPVAVSLTIEQNGTMLAGQDAEAAVVALQHADLLYVGLNCATGPAFMTDDLRALSELARTRVACVPNAGLPDEEGLYHESPAAFRDVFARFLDEGWLNLVGGCCGTTPAHVTALANLVRERRPRKLPEHGRAFVSGLEAVELLEDNRPLLIGERTNALGSSRFRNLVANEQWEEAAEIGRRQVRSGGQILDVCLQDPERDEVGDMTAFLDRLLRLVKVPVMIDSTDPDVMAAALPLCQGKAVLNSVNLEGGRERFDRVVRLAQGFGAALVVGLIDEEGMAVTVKRKLEIAARCHRVLTDEFGVRPEDIWWDALTFPCATGDETYVGSARRTLEAIRQLKETFPGTRSTLGVSNVSFGLPPAGREVLNAVFLYHATEAGLDTAIVNAQRLARYPEIPARERELAEDLLFTEATDVEASRQAVEAFTAFFRERSPSAKPAATESLPLAERLVHAVVEGSKTGLVRDLDEALADPRWPTPLDIVNGPLMQGMHEVGRLFNEHQLIVAEVLQSAEVMKAAVRHLEPHMDTRARGGRGTVLLATVKGDVHDIGRNLVDIILTNNGFHVVSLGIKVPSERLIEEAVKHRPDIIGLSGLLVRSAHEMVRTAGDLRAAGIDTPLLVGGAALSRRFTHRKIAPAYGGLCTYAHDAMEGLSLAERIVDSAARPQLERDVREAIAADSAPLPARPATGNAGRVAAAAREVRRDLPVPVPRDTERHVEELDLDEVWTHLNPQMLYGRHLGLRGSVARHEREGDERYGQLRGVVEHLKAFSRDGGMRCSAVWRFLPARTEGETLRLLDPDTGEVAAAWRLPRQELGDRLCLTDYVLDDDHVALFVTTTGRRVPRLAASCKHRGAYLRSHAFSALAIETAEAAAELLHARLREQWGIPEKQGRRYSFGYPSCPDLAGQRALFDVLRPQEIGVTLTGNDMMDPEASVSALVFHHPDARHFRA